MRIVVYRGHSVSTPSGTFMPGDEVDLVDDEAQRLIKLGHVHKPGEPARVWCGEQDHEQYVDLERARGAIEHTYQPGPAISQPRPARK